MNQEDFDLFLAKGMQAIHQPKVSERLVKSIVKNDPVAGLAGATRASVAKIVDTFKKTSKPIPANMIPDLSLELTGQLAEMVTAKTGVEIDQPQVLEAYKSFIQDYTSDGIRGGNITKEQLQQDVTKLQPQEQQQEQVVMQPSPGQSPLQQSGMQKFDPFNPKQTMSQKLDRGLLS